MMLHRLVEPIVRAQGIAEVRVQRGVLGVGGERQAMMRKRGVELAREPQSHTQIVVQLGVIGPHREQLQIGRDRLVEPAGAVCLGSEPDLLHEGIGFVGEQRRRFARSGGFWPQRMDRRGVVHIFDITSDSIYKPLYLNAYLER